MSSEAKSSQHAALPTRRATVCNSKVRHQIARQELARPLLSDLTLQIPCDNLEILLRDRGVLECGDDVIDDVVNELGGDEFSRVGNAHAVLDPLPQLDTSDFGGRGVLHKIVERNTTIASEPSGTVGKGSGDVTAETFRSYLSWYCRVEQVCCCHFHVFTSYMILKELMYMSILKG